MSEGGRDAERIALGLLSRREHSRVELARKLERRGFARETIEQAVERLVARGLLSEPRFCEAFVRSRIERGEGPVRIRHALRERGVDPGAIESALEAADQDWGELLEAVRARRFGAEVPADHSDRMRQARFLERRGFAPDQIMRVLGGGSAR